MAPVHAPTETQCPKTPGYQNHKQANQTLSRDPHSGARHSTPFSSQSRGKPPSMKKTAIKGKTAEFPPVWSSNRKIMIKKNEKIPPPLCQHLNTCDASSFRERKRFVCSAAYGTYSPLGLVLGILILLLLLLYDSGMILSCQQYSRQDGEKHNAHLDDFIPGEDQAGDVLSGAGHQISVKDTENALVSDDQKIILLTLQLEDDRLHTDSQVVVALR